MSASVTGLYHLDEIAAVLLKRANAPGAHSNVMRIYLAYMYGPYTNSIDPAWTRCVLRDPHLKDTYVKARYADGCSC